MKTLKAINEITSEHMYSLVKDIFTNNIDFSIVINNNNDWDYELPERLQKEPKFVLEIMNITKQESFIEDNKLTICTEFDDNKYTKVLQKEDIFGIIIDGKQYLMKTYNDERPEIKAQHPKRGVDSKELQAKSTRAFIKNNPELEIK